MTLFIYITAAEADSASKERVNKVVELCLNPNHSRYFQGLKSTEGLASPGI